MNAAAIAVVVAICVCIVVLGVAIFVAVHITRGQSPLPSWRCTCPKLRSGRRKRRHQRNREEDELNAKNCKDIELLPLDKVMAKLAGCRARKNYIYARHYIEAHPMDESEGRLSSHDLEYVIENGANAWEFVPSQDNVGVTVRNCTNLEFSEGENSLVANLQFPNEQRVYYYEVRLDSVPEGTNVAVGVAMRGYPPLRMAGWADNSVAYHTIDGTAYYAHPLHACRKALGSAHTSDTVGVGWRPFSGKMFFAINGVIVCHIRTPWAHKRMYPVVSADGPCSLSVNVGARAFVLAHGNMRHWGLASTEGSRPPPPMYHNMDGTVLLASTPSLAEDLAHPPSYESSTAASERHTSIPISDDSDLSDIDQDIRFGVLDSAEVEDAGSAEFSYGYSGISHGSRGHLLDTLLEIAPTSSSQRRYSISSLGIPFQQESSRRNSTPSIHFFSPF
ncbi:Protein ssh4 [Coemansia sp. RSA 1290]|nr:Protein ssh4 [Coemansia sp. RSA 990]KAJ2628464.1 Protein ssh4 [Coemansia sp. RSA 1290]KAJ2647383.1 Protein ssh4 [Coemansia sp. RSA 1250]KAJ2669293.1 Protein ssh4 [Coemansia sp. RSA 1085]